MSVVIEVVGHKHTPDHTLLFVLHLKSGVNQWSSKAHAVERSLLQFYELAMTK
jgi:hypothetical protein